jgi:hypothetical protein
VIFLFEVLFRHVKHESFLFSVRLSLIMRGMIMVVTGMVVIVMGIRSRVMAVVVSGILASVFIAVMPVVTVGVGSDLLDAEVPDSVHRCLGQAREEFAVGGLLNREGVATVVDLIGLPQRGQPCACKHESSRNQSNGGEVGYRRFHFPARKS